MTVWKLLFGVMLVSALGGAWLTWQSRLPRVPEGIFWGNGRIEADDVDIATRYPGRVEAVLAEEGDWVEAGQVLARMRSAEAEAQLREAEARAKEAVERVAVASALIAQRESECSLAEKDLRRARELLEQEVGSQQRVDVESTRVETAKAACDAAEARRLDAEAAIEAARARVQQIRTRVDESVLRAPIAGRVLYRLAEPGEVLPAGGKILTLLDMQDVYMEIFLPSAQASLVPIGADALIVLDALPDLVTPATVSFVSPEAQFTPKQVETPSEREKLMFRVKVRIPPELLTARLDRVKTGVRGVAYVRVADSEASPWPEHLQGRRQSDSP